MKGSFLIFVVIAITALADRVVDKNISPHWANPKVENHFYKIDSDTSQTNAIFIGSSFTQSGFNPILFDSLMDGRTNSFNFGWEYFVIPETLFCLDNIIDSKKNSGNKEKFTIFLELNKLHSVDMHQKSNRFYYMLNESSFSILWEAIENKNVSHLQKLKLRISLFQGYLINYFNFGILGDKILHHLSGSPMTVNVDFDLTKGYRPAYRTLSESSVAKFNRYKTDIEMVRRSPPSQKQYPKFTDYILTLQAKAREKNIEIVYVTLPGVIDQSIINLIPLLPKNKYLDFGDPSSELFYSINRKNRGHLNDTGATIFTSMLADKCKENNYFN